MDAFPLTINSLWFKIFVVITIIWLTTKILRNLFIDRIINDLIKLPDDRKERLIRLYRSSISTWSIFFRLSPLALIALLCLATLPVVGTRYLNEPDFDIFRQPTAVIAFTLVVAYGHMLEDTSYNKKILKAIDKSIEREVS